MVNYVKTIYAAAWFLNQYEFVSESTVTVDGSEVPIYFWAK